MANAIREFKAICRVNDTSYDVLKQPTESDPSVTFVTFDKEGEPSQVVTCPPVGKPQWRNYTPDLLD